MNNDKEIDMDGCMELKFEPDLQTALEAEVARLKRIGPEPPEELHFNTAMANLAKSRPELLKGTIMEHMHFVEDR